MILQTPMTAAPWKMWPQNWTGGLLLGLRCAGAGARFSICPLSRFRGERCIAFEVPGQSRRENQGSLAGG